MFKKWMEKSKKDQRGLTLVELLAVVVILAIVAAIAFVLIGNVIDNSKQDAHVSNAQQIISAAKTYESTVSDIDGSVKVETLQSEGLLDKNLADPWKKATDYGKNATVTKNTDGEYTITNFDGHKCTLGEAKEAVLRDGRKACDENKSK